MPTRLKPSDPAHTVVLPRAGHAAVRELAVLRIAAGDTVLARTPAPA